MSEDEARKAKLAAIDEMLEQDGIWRRLANRIRGVVKHRRILQGVLLGERGDPRLSAAESRRLDPGIDIGLLGGAETAELALEAAVETAPEVTALPAVMTESEAQALARKAPVPEWARKGGLTREHMDQVDEAFQQSRALAGLSQDPSLVVRAGPRLAEGARPGKWTGWGDE